MTATVFHNAEPVVEVGEDWLERLKAAAAAAETRRARLCLHPAGDDPLHEMIIVFHRDTLVAPHRHLRKSESFHALFGEIDVLLFDDQGAPVRRVSLGPPGSGRSTVYRLQAPLWHSVLVRSEFAAIHEVTNGPFDPAEAETAPWAPAAGEALRRFLSKADAALG